jgi:hypothetical protein
VKSVELNPKRAGSEMLTDLNCWSMRIVRIAQVNTDFLSSDMNGPF